MSDNFIPIISSSPPPLDFGDDDNDGDFTEFTTADRKWSVDEEFSSVECPLPETKDSSQESPVKLSGTDLTDKNNLFLQDSNEIRFVPVLPAHSGSDNSEISKSGNWSNFSGNDCTDISKISFQDLKNTGQKATTNNGPAVDEALKSNHENGILLEKNSVENGFMPASQNEGLSSTPVGSDGISETMQVNTVVGSLHISDSSSPGEAESMESMHTESVNESENISVNHQNYDTDGSPSSDNEYQEAKTNLSAETVAEQTSATTEKNLQNAEGVFVDRTEIAENGDPEITHYDTSDFAAFDAAVTDSDTSFVSKVSTAQVDTSYTTGNSQIRRDQLQNNNGVTDDVDLSESCDETENNNETQQNYDAFSFSPEATESDDSFADFSAFPLPPTENSSDQEPINHELHTSASRSISATCNLMEKNEEHVKVNNDLNEVQVENFTNFRDESDDFADFQTNSDGFPTAMDDDDDEFGDFTEMSQATDFVSLPPKHMNAGISNVPVWFPCTLPSDDNDCSLPIICQLEDDALSVFHPVSDNSPDRLHNAQQLMRPSQLWDQLEDIDNAVALKFGWNDSSHHQQLLASLGIETQNILFGRTSEPYYVPAYYAAGLGMLEPGNDLIKPVSAAEKITAVSPKEKTPPTNSSEVWKTENGDNHVATGSGACAPSANSNGSGGVDKFAYPCAIDPSTMNLDMLSRPSMNGSVQTSHSEQDKVDPELLELAMNVTPNPATKRPDPLSKILASFGVSSTSKKMQDEDENLSEDAKKVIKKLPQLSFMRSNVLMFPVGKSAVPHG